MDPTSQVDPEAGEVPESLNALVHLHKEAGNIRGLDPKDPRLSPISTRSALQSVADSPLDEVKESARLAILYDLIREDNKITEKAPAELLAVAKSVADEHEVDAERLLTDVATSAINKEPLSETESQGMKPHVTAFIGQDVCQIGKVQVNGIDATWIFSEFETDAPFDHLASWVDPNNWPKFGPLLFKKMKSVAEPPMPIGALGKKEEHWHSVFLEEVQLLRRIDTLLHCDHWRHGDEAVGMTYELTESLDNVINVDRGFLLVNKSGGRNRVKALKIVGFTDDVWDWVATYVCPFWTDFIRGAVEDGMENKPPEFPEEPLGGSPTDLWGDLFVAWMEFFGDSGKAYFDLFGDTFSRVTGGDYTAADWVEDGAKTWSQLAKDWATAWSFGLDLVNEVKDEGLDASFMPPDRKAAEPERGKGMASSLRATASATAANTTLIPVPGLHKNQKLECSALESIEQNGPVIPAEQVLVTMETLPDDTPAVRISLGPNAAPGLYVGTLATKGRKMIVPAQIYVSGARPMNGG